MRSWVEVGLDPAMMWRLTYREAQTIMNGAVERLKADHNARAWGVWHTAALTRIKKMPPLSSMLVGAPAKPKKMTGDDIEGAMLAWFGKRAISRKL